MRTLACLAVLLALSTASDRNGDSFRVFGPDVAVTMADRAMLERGLPIVLILDAEEHGLAVFTAIEVGYTVNGHLALDAYRDGRKPRL